MREVKGTTAHVDFLDGLRGIAVLLVVGYHLHEIGLLPDPFKSLGITIYVPWIFLGGILGVEIFFFISGFVLFYPYARHLVEGSARPALGHFIGRRARKIVPSYVVVVLAVSLIAPGRACAGAEPHEPRARTPVLRARLLPRDVRFDRRSAVVAGGRSRVLRRLPRCYARCICATFGSAPP